MQKEKIISRLKEIEKSERIKILYAVESGSRAWGFESKDSDWDIRFIYIRPIEWYLTLEEGKDYLEFPLQDGLDINGWDLKKALKLFRKSNPPLFEWLNSPIKYLENKNISEKLRLLTKEYFNPKTSTYHYLHMATGNYKDYLKRDLVKVKKYFYVLRPLLACQWIENRQTMPPMEFEILLKTQVNQPKVIEQIEKLLIRKRKGEEMNMEARNEILNSFIEDRIEYFTSEVKKKKIFTIPDSAKLNELFRNVVY